jgi:hypothetical protein
MSETSKALSEKLAALGFELTILSGPRGEVSEDNWPNIRFDVALKFKGKPVLESKYSLGVGHVDPKKARIGSVISNPRLTADEEGMLFAWQRQPHAAFKEKQRQATLAAKLAAYQKVAPDLASVLHSLLSDGDAFFNAQTFEDWASDLGYDTDSRKAESIYRLCDETGRKLSRVPAGVLNEARQLLQDF